MTSLIFSKPKNTDDEDLKKEISIRFKELAVLSKYLPNTESQIIDKLLNVIADLNNPQILKSKMLKLAIAPRWVSL